MRWYKLDLFKLYLDFTLKDSLFKNITMDGQSIAAIMSYETITLNNVTFEDIKFLNEFKLDFLLTQFYSSGTLTIENLKYKDIQISLSTSLILFDIQNTLVVANGIIFENITASETSSLIKITKTEKMTINDLSFID